MSVVPGRGRSNAEWIAARQGAGADQAAALAGLRAHLLRAARFTLEQTYGRTPSSEAPRREPASRCRLQGRGAP